jgi:integrase
MQGFWSATSSTFSAAQSNGQKKTFADLYGFIETDYINNQRKSIRNVKGAWKAHLREAFGSHPLADYDPTLIQNYVRSRLAAGAKNATVNRELAVIKRMANLGLQLLKIEDERMRGALMLWGRIKGLRERNVRQGYLKDAEYDALARETAKAGVWLRGMFECACTYGWRKSELLGLRVSQIDLKERTISLNPGETKNDDARTVEMTEAVFQLISASIADKRPDERVFTRTSRLTQRARPIADFRKAWARATQAAGVPDLLFHDLRRTGVRNMRRRGITDRVAMLITGHKTHSMLQRYSIVDREDLRDAVRKMEEWEKNRQRLAELEKQEKLIFGPAEAQPKKPN